jgi:hypothetical protein
MHYDDMLPLQRVCTVNMAGSGDHTVTGRLKLNKVLTYLARGVVAAVGVGVYSSYFGSALLLLLAITLLVL